jgi:hypothetical protein
MSRFLLTPSIEGVWILPHLVSVNEVPAKSPPSNDREAIHKAAKAEPAAFEEACCGGEFTLLLDGMKSTVFFLSSFSCLLMLYFLFLDGFTLFVIIILSY